MNSRLKPLNSNSLLALYNLLILDIQLSHHLHHRALFLHHFHHDFVEELRTVLSHSKSLHFSFGIDGSGDQGLVYFTAVEDNVVLFVVFSPVNQFFVWTPLGGVEVVPPFSVYCVVLFPERSDIIVKFLEEWRLGILIELLHHFMVINEEMNVVDHTLLLDAVKAASPDVLVPVLEVLELDHQVVDAALVEVYLRFPQIFDHVLFEVLGQDAP